MSSNASSHEKCPECGRRNLTPGRAAFLEVAGVRVFADSALPDDEVHLSAKNMTRLCEYLTSGTYHE